MSHRGLFEDICHVIYVFTQKSPQKPNTEMAMCGKDLWRPRVKPSSRMWEPLKVIVKVILEEKLPLVLKGEENRR